MRSVFLVRHGQCLDNKERILNGHRDTDLTPLGRRQSLEAARELKSKNIKAIYSSPLSRAKHTAMIIAEDLGIEKVHIDKGLIERDFGYMTGKAVKDIKQLSDSTFEINNVTYFFDGPKVETFPRVYLRAKRVLKKILAKEPTGNIVIVTHGDVGMMMQAVFYGWDWLRGLKHSFWKNGEIFELKENPLKD